MKQQPLLQPAGSLDTDALQDFALVAGVATVSGLVGIALGAWYVHRRMYNDKCKRGAR